MMMIHILFCVGMVLAVLGFGLVFFPNAVFRLNRFLNQQVRADTFVRRYNIWVGLFFLILGLMLMVLYTGF
jgi:hypothetical protein